jgi:hypothetical protein
MAGHVNRTQGLDWRTMAQRESSHGGWSLDFDWPFGETTRKTKAARLIGPMSILNIRKRVGVTSGLSLTAGTCMWLMTARKPAASRHQPRTRVALRPVTTNALEAMIPSHCWGLEEGREAPISERPHMMHHMICMRSPFPPEPCLFASEMRCSRL